MSFNVPPSLAKGGARVQAPGADSLHPIPGRVFWLVVLGIGVFIFISRLPLASRFLFSWDAASYALALDEYNVYFHQPHPPGNPLYVAAAWLIHRWVADANLSYVLLAILGSAIATAGVFGLTARLFGLMAGLLASWLFATSPLVWSHGEVAYPYIFLALFTVLVAWCAVETCWGGRDLTVVGGALLGLGAGFRPELFFWLLPAWLYGARRNLRAMVWGGVLAAVIIAAWAIPMVELSQGWATYIAMLQTYQEYWIAPPVGKAAFLRAAVESGSRALGHVVYAMGPALVLLALGLGRLAIRPNTQLGRLGVLLALLVGPAMAFDTFAHIGNQGYVLAIVPPLFVGMAGGLVRLLSDSRSAVASRRGRGLVVTGTAVALFALAGLANGAIFLFREGEGSLRHIRANDVMLRSIIDYVRAHYKPESGLVIAGDTLRQLSYYLPKYDAEQHLVPLWASADPVVLAGVERLDRPQGVRGAVVVDVSAADVRQAPEIRQVRYGPGRGEYLFDVQLGPSKTLVFGAGRLSVERRRS